MPLFSCPPCSRSGRLSPFSRKNLTRPCSFPRLPLSITTRLIQGARPCPCTIPDATPPASRCGAQRGGRADGMSWFLDLRHITVPHPLGPSRICAHFFNFCRIPSFGGSHEKQLQFLLVHHGHRGHGPYPGPDRRLFAVLRQPRQHGHLRGLLQPRHRRGRGPAPRAHRPVPASRDHGHGAGLPGRCPLLWRIPRPRRLRSGRPLPAGRHRSHRRPGLPGLPLARHHASGRRRRQRPSGRRGAEDI